MTATTDGFVRIAAATPEIRVGDVSRNADAIVACVRRAADAGAHALVLPELCLTGCTCGDLFLDQALLVACERALKRVLVETTDLPLLFTVGLPIAWNRSVYNCAAVCCAGRLLGLTAKHRLSDAERRWFAPADHTSGRISLRELRETVPFGSDTLYCCVDEGLSGFVFGVEVGGDTQVPEQLSTSMARAGAIVILNPSASPRVVGQAARRRAFIVEQSGRLHVGYASAEAGWGESTTDYVFAGENLIVEDGDLLAKTELFTCDMALADIDLARLVSERRRQTASASAGEDGGQRGYEEGFSFAGLALFGPPLHPEGPVSLFVTSDEEARAVGEDAACDAIPAPVRPAYSALDTLRVFPRLPFVPDDAAERAERCEEILALQAVALATRMAHTGTKSLVIGLSGGLDSTLALLVSVRAADRLGLPRTCVHAVSMPGFGTTGRTKGNAEKLAELLGADFREIPIGVSVERHFADIGHDPAVRDATYENAQARERTQILMDLAGDLNGFVVGTGDLSELALGWATYNGDHMSMYSVNGSIPKTLIRYLVRHAADALGGEAASVLRDIVDTPVSPELLPPTGAGEIAQRTEDLVGPYELHDYFLYYLLRFGFAPGRIYRQACRSFAGVYEPETILAWLKVFYRRFFSQQFKRSCMPDGPGVGPVGMSPRGGWSMPSDASARLWLDELEELDR